ncbi:MAG: hypothetical protein WCG96_11360 [Actinomycetes bacterium]
MTRRTQSTTELLRDLRGDRASRPVVDPMLAGGLRAWLDDELAGTFDAFSSDLPIDLPAWKIAQPAASSDPEHENGGLSALVHALILDHLVFGEVIDPLVEAMSLLEARGDHDPLLRQIGSLDGLAAEQLAEEVATHTAVLSRELGRIPGSWLPRSSASIAAQICGGRVRIGAAVDLMLGPPARSVSSICLLEVVTTPLGAHLFDHLAAMALIETLRSGAAPLRVAALSTATGDHIVLEVNDDLLVGALHRVVDVTAERVRSLIVDSNEASISRLHP